MDNQDTPKKGVFRIPKFILEGRRPIQEADLDKDPNQEMVAGVKLVAGFHIIVIFLSFVYQFSALSRGSSNLFMGLIFTFECLAVIQLIYVVPALIVTLIMRKFEMALGILLAMGLTVLLAGASFGLCTVAIFTRVLRF